MISIMPGFEQRNQVRNNYFVVFQLDSLTAMKNFWSAFCTSIFKFALKGSGDSVSIPGGVGFDFFRHFLRIYDMAEFASARS